MKFTNTREALTRIEDIYEKVAGDYDSYNTLDADGKMIFELETGAQSPSSTK